MDLQTVVLSALRVSIWLVVLSLGLRASMADLTFLIRRPGLLARSLVALFLVVPAFAVVLDLAFPLPPEIRFALVALAVSPLPAGLPRKQAKLRARGDYAIGLLVTAAIVSVAATPLLIGLASQILGAHARITAAQVARVLATSIGAPLAAGLIFRLAAPRLAPATARVAQFAGTALLTAGALLLVVAAWPTMVGLMHGGAVLAIAGTVVLALAAGHLLGAGEDEASGALALAAATRHPAVAMAIAAANYPDRTRTIAAAVLLFVLIAALISAPYAWWMRRRRATRGAAQGGGAAGAPAGGGTVT